MLFPPEGDTGSLDTVLKKPLLCLQLLLFLHQAVSDGSGKTWTPRFVPSLRHSVLREVGGQWMTDVKGCPTSDVEGAGRQQLTKNQKVGVARNMIYLKTKKISGKLSGLVKGSIKGDQIQTHNN